MIKVNKKTLTRYTSVAKIFDWGEAKPQITRNDVIKIFRKEGHFTGQRCRRMKDQKPGPGLPYNLGFAKQKGLEPNFNSFPKLLKLEDFVSKLV